MSSDTIAICASGPSLCSEDIHRLRDNKITVVTVNSSWMIYPDCQYIFAGDEAWWNANYHRIYSTAEKWTCSETAARIYGINYFETKSKDTFNSGMMAILFAVSLGVEDIILLGYDCSLEKGLHWHGMHTGMNNPTGYSIQRWKQEFIMLASEMRHRVNIVNCSRESRLDCFPVVSLKSTMRRVNK